MKFNNSLLCTAAFLAISYSTPALAQSSPTESAGNNTNNADIVVTAQKREERLLDVPLSVTAVTGNELTKQGIASPENLTKVVPGFTVQKNDFGVPIFSIRGVGYFDRIIGTSPTVGVYVDQVPVQLSYESLGSAIDLQRVEVLKGPQGTLFGNNATGGAINFIANKPTDKLEAGVNLDYGRFNAVNAQAFVSGPLGPNLKARIVGRYEYADPWQKSDPTNDRLLGVPTGRENGRRRFATGRFILDWQPSEQLKFEFSANGWHDASDQQAPQFLAFAPNSPTNPTRAYIYAALQPLVPSGDNARLAGFDPGRDFAHDSSFYQLSLRGDLDLSDSLTLTSITAYSHLKVDQLVDGDGTSYVSINTRQTVSPARHFSQELRLAGTLPRLRWILGGNYADERINETRVVESFNVTNNFFTVAGGFTGVALPLDQRPRTIAGFGSLEYDLTDQLTVQAAARYTDQKRDATACLQDPGDGSISRVFNILFAGLNAGAGDCTTQSARGVRINGDGLFRDTLKENNFSYRINASYKVTDDVLFYANVTKGYKAGGYSALPGIFAGAFVPAKQESVLSLEAGMKGTFADRKVQLEAAVFDLDYSNKQILGTVVDPIFGPFPQLLNVPKSHITGAEASITLRPVSGLRVLANGTYLDSKIQKNPLNPVDALSRPTNLVGTDLPSTPKFFWSVDGEYSFPVSDSLSASFGANYSHTSSTDSALGAVPSFRIAGYGLLDLRASIGAADENWRVSIWGRNVTNEFYAFGTSRPRDTLIRYTGMPVTYGVSFSYRYR